MRVNNLKSTGIIEAHRSLTLQRLSRYLMRNFFPVFLLLFLCKSAFAQKTTVYTEPDREFKTAAELFDKKKYGSALKSFQNVIETNKNQKSLYRIDAEFYASACAIELVNKDGEWRMKKFIETHPESNKVKWGYFYLGKSNYRKKKYPETIEYLEKVDVLDLDKDDACEFRFKRGYSYIETKKLRKQKLTYTR